MSLFFLNLSLCAYAVTVFIAKRTAPQRDFVFSKTTIWQKSKMEFDQQVQTWLNRNPNKVLIFKNKNSYIVSVNPSWITFGYFYHIDIQENADHLMVQVSLQAKLVSNPFDESQFNRTIAEEFQLKDVG